MEQAFRPLPLLSNPHLQTLLSTLLKKRSTFLPVAFRKIRLDDGDALAVDDTTPRAWLGGDPIALLVHGLGGTARSGYMVRIADRLNRAGLRVLRMNLRGAGAGVRLARKTYHAGCSSDVRAVVESLQKEAPNSPLFLAGFSLGGNIVLKLAGEESLNPLPSLKGVAAVAPPIDMIECSRLLSAQPFYDRYFARSLRIQVSRHQRMFPDLPAVRFPKVQSLRAFDDAYTAPRNGFADSLDYYRRTSALPLTPKIRVPAFILASRDDPFISAASFEGLPRNGTIKVVLQQHGGHLGFLGWDGAGGIRWAERRVAEWLIVQARTRVFERAGFS
ncbi:MAG: alpha/beta fold hydrolase [Planctomycetes bacterium]|nr:alpha/beta fold hydrolase [Planctomycetota bacterium]